MESAALIFMAGMLPVLFMLGAATAYCVMTQQKIFALAHVPQHRVTFYGVADRDAGSIIKSYQRAGYSVESFGRNRLSGLFEIKMKLAV